MCLNTVTALIHISDDNELFSCCQVPVPAPADVLQQNSQSDGEVDLPAEQQQRPSQPEDWHHPPPLCEPTAKGCRSDPFQAVSV